MTPWPGQLLRSETRSCLQDGVRVLASTLAQLAGDSRRGHAEDDDDEDEL